MKGTQSELAEARRRFEAKVKYGPDCFEWAGAHSKRTGHGYFTLKGQQTGAPRAAWILQKGEIPEGLVVLHRCSNPRCVRVEHLYLGTAGVRTQDMADKHRHPHIKVTEDPWERFAQADDRRLAEEGSA